MSDKPQKSSKQSDHIDEKAAEKPALNSEVAADSQTDAKGKTEIEQANPDFPTGSASDIPDPEGDSLQIVEAITGNVLAERPKTSQILDSGTIKSLSQDNPLAAAGSAMLDATSDPRIRDGIKKDISDVLRSKTHNKSKEPILDEDPNYEGGTHKVPDLDQDSNLVAYRQDMDGEQFGVAPKNPNAWKEFFDESKKHSDKNKERIAESNMELLYQFLTGFGADVQGHYDKSDPVLQDFVKSPGATAIRKQYLKSGCPDFTDKLGYGTMEAFVGTIAKPIYDVSTPPASALVSDGEQHSHLKGLLDRDHLGSVGLQVGGFGNPPKDKYPWAATLARKCNQDGIPNPNGNHVQFQVMNLAGLHSFGYHVPNLDDRPVGSKGPMRTIIQIFRWVEPLPKEGDFNE